MIDMWSEALRNIFPPLHPLNCPVQTSKLGILREGIEEGSDVMNRSVDQSKQIFFDVWLSVRVGYDVEVDW